MLATQVNYIVIAAPPGGGGMSQILQFMLILGILVLAAKLAGWLSTLAGQPAVLGELLAGVLLGPSLLNIYGLPFVTEHGTAESTIHNLSELGVVLLMFTAGLEINLKEMRKVGKVAVFAGVNGVIFPIVFGGLTALIFGYSQNGLDKGIFIGLILAATSVSISVQTMRELGVIKKKEGIALLGAAVFDDVLVVLLLSFFIALSGSGGGLLDIGLVIAKMAAFFIIVYFFGVKIVPWLLTKVRRLPISEGLMATVVVLTVLIAWAAEYLGGVAMIVGSFLIGAMIGQTRFRHELEEKLHVLLYALLVPIFFVSIGLIIDVKIVPGEVWVFAIVLTIVAILSKIIGCGLGARLAGFSNLSSLRLGVGMVSRGEVGLIVATAGLTQGFITANVFAAIVVVVLATTLFTPFALKLVFKGDGKNEIAPGISDDSKPIAKELAPTVTSEK